MVKCIECGKEFVREEGIVGKPRQLCSKECRNRRDSRKSTAWQKKVVRKRRLSMKVKCIECGKTCTPMISRGPPRKTCSLVCHRKKMRRMENARRKAKRIITMECKCQECGKEFTRKNEAGPRPKTCSPPCRITRIRRQHRRHAAKHREALKI